MFLAALLYAKFLGHEHGFASSLPPYLAASSVRTALSIVQRQVPMSQTVSLAMKSFRKICIQHLGNLGRTVACQQSRVVGAFFSTIQQPGKYGADVILVDVQVEVAVAQQGSFGVLCCLGILLFVCFKPEVVQVKARKAHR